MNNFNNNQSQPEAPADLNRPWDKPLMPQTPVDSKAPIAPEVVKPAVVKKEAPVKKEPKAPVDNRAAYNCAACNGSGLIKDSRSEDALCTTCNGTGKV